MPDGKYVVDPVTMKTKFVPDQFVVVVGFEDYGPEVYGPFNSMAEASQAADGWSFEGETREVEYITSREVKQ